jgi:putative transposase
VEAELSRSLGDLRPVVLYLDGLNAGASSTIVAMGVDADGEKHVLGLRLGSTENAVLCTDLVQSLPASSPWKNGLKGPSGLR